MTPPRTVTPELVDNRDKRLVFLDGEVCYPLRRRHSRQNQLMQNLVHALAHYRLVAATVGGLTHHLVWYGWVNITDILNEHIGHYHHNHSINTHIEPLLRAHLLDQQNLGDPQLHPHVRNRLAVYKILLQPHMSPNRFHHAQAHRVVVIADTDRRKLVGDRAIERLQPRDERLVSLQLCDHALAIGRRLIRPVDPALHHLVACHVHDAHCGRVDWCGVVGGVRVVA